MTDQPTETQLGFDGLKKPVEKEGLERLVPGKYYRVEKPGDVSYGMFVKESGLYLIFDPLVSAGSLDEGIFPPEHRGESLLAAGAMIGVTPSSEAAFRQALLNCHPMAPYFGQFVEVHHADGQTHFGKIISLAKRWYALCPTISEKNEGGYRVPCIETGVPVTYTLDSFSQVKQLKGKKEFEEVFKAVQEGFAEEKRIEEIKEQQMQAQIAQLQAPKRKKKK